MALDERAGGPHRHAAGPQTDLLVPALRAVSFLSQLSSEQLGELAAAGQVIALEAGQDVFCEGDEGESLYVVLSGSVRVYTCDGEGYAVEVDRKQAGESFGEVALLDGGRRSASVGTSEPCVLFTLDRAVLAAFLSRHPALLTTLLTHVTTMVRRNVERIMQDEMVARLLRVESELARHRAVDEMVAGVAHEINTPLGTIVTAASIVKRLVGSELIPHLTGHAETRGLLEDAMEAVTLIERNAQRAHQLIQSFKKISVSQITDTKERLNLPAALEEIVGLYRITAKRAGLLVTVHPELPAGSGEWEGYLGFLTQIMLNLLTDVERYAYPAGAGGRVDITLADGPAGRHAQCISTATFTGRARRAARLGACRSRPAGTDGPPRAGRSGRREAATCAQTRVSEILEGAACVAESIAVVSDDPAFLVAVRGVLAGGGYAALELAAEAGALHVLQAAAPALIVLDIGPAHPESDWRLLEQIRSAPTLAGGPVIVCAAPWDLRHHAADLRRYQAAVLPKPCDPADLAMLLPRLIGHGGS